MWPGRPHEKRMPKTIFKKRSRTKTEQGRGRGGSACFKCGEEGYQSSECAQRKTPDVAKERNEAVSSVERKDTCHETAPKRAKNTTAKKRRDNRSPPSSTSKHHTRYRHRNDRRNVSQGRAPLCKPKEGGQLIYTY
jgi:hypothetical protein